MKGRASRVLASLALAANWACQPVQAPDTAIDKAGPPPGAVWEGEAFTFQQVRDDIYHAVGTGNLTIGCNGSVIINENDVLLVDSHMTPAASWALLKELKSITHKPVRYVVNTHFHFDHAHGNQTFGEDVEVIGHEFTREQLVSGASMEGRAWDAFVGGLPERIQETESKLQMAIDATNPNAEAELRKQVSILKNYQDATNAIVPTPPTITLRKRMTLTRGGREIQLLYFGRGHTGGDVVVYLPEDKAIVTGDLLTNGLAYMGNAYLNEWADTLDEVKKLDFDVVLPGHGRAFEDIEKIDHFQAYLRDLWPKIVAKHKAGVSEEEAAQTIDMTNHAEHFSQIDGPGVHPHAVQRAYALLNGTEH